MNKKEGETREKLESRISTLLSRLTIVSLRNHGTWLMMTDNSIRKLYENVILEPSSPSLLFQLKYISFPSSERESKVLKREDSFFPSFRSLLFLITLNQKSFLDVNFDPLAFQHYTILYKKYSLYIKK